MGFIEWNDKAIVNHIAMDKDHKKMVDDTNKLHSYVTSNKTEKANKLLLKIVDDLKIHFDIFGIDKTRKIIGMSGFAGQQILIDLDNKRIIVVNSLYRNYNWKKIVHSAIKG